MVWQIFEIVAVISFLVYLWYLRMFRVGIGRGRDLINYAKPRVSVVVAARNEAPNIGRLLTALVNQSYSAALYEIIIANDGSSDETSRIVEEFAARWNNIILLNVTGRETVVSPKKNALAQAIATASGEIILLTDADCLTGKNWLESMLANFDDADMVVGFSQTQLRDWKKASLEQKFEHFDFTAMFLAAAGAISAGKYFSCSGQNLAYQKISFEKVGGFEKIKHLVSGDDLNLMQLFRKHGMKVRFAFSPTSFVFTQPVKNWRELFGQRSRWASNMKWQIILNPEFFSYLLSVYLVVLVPLALLFHNWRFAVLILFLRLILEYGFLKRGYEKLNLAKNRLSFYPAWIILQPVYFVIVSILGGLNLFSWKK